MSIKNMVVSKTLNIMREKVINPRMADIGKVKSLEWTDGKLTLVFTLNGLDETDISVICNHVSISPDGESISVSDFSSNMPFVENALNSFAAREYRIDEGSMVKMALLTAKKVLGL